MTRPGGAPSTAPRTPPEAPALRDLDPVRSLLVLFDKTFRTSRTYGPQNTIAQRFVHQLYEQLSAQLALDERLSLLVQRFELFCEGEPVYQNPDSTENLAFKLYADGIRELTFARGLSREDLAAFLEIVGGEYESGGGDEDIVTRLWEKNLSAISVVTAEEIVKSSELTEVLDPQNDGAMGRPSNRVGEIQETEASRARAGLRGEVSERLPELSVSRREMEVLAKEIEAESTGDSVDYALDVLLTLLAVDGETWRRGMSALGSELLELCIERGAWTRALELWAAARAAEARGGLGEAERAEVALLLQTLNRRETLRAVEAVLHGGGAVQGLGDLLLALDPSMIGDLCNLLGNLEREEHRAVVRDALAMLARRNPDPVLRGLGDSRSRYVRDLLAVLERTENPRLADALEAAREHPDPHVRLAATRTFVALRPTGNAAVLVRFVEDPEGPVRIAALKALGGGSYSTPLSAWSPVLESRAFAERSPAEKRATFIALGASAGDAAVALLRPLLTRSAWTSRARKEAIASLAVEALLKIGTPAAVAALEAGTRRINRVIRGACREALGALAQRTA